MAKNIWTTLKKLGAGFNNPNESYWLTRDLFIRALGFIYFFVFLPLIFQYKGLLGSNGLLPVAHYLEAAKNYFPNPYWWNLPTLFWLNHSDIFALTLFSFGLVLSIITMLGFGNSIILFFLWLLQLSITHVGQDFWSFGWESNLLEIGFLAIFLVPLWKGPNPPSKIIIYLLRWVLFRLMLGAGLIKLRGDACWRDLTCLVYHYETQPIPNPLSPLFHYSPVIFQKASVLANHFVELICPFLLFFSYRIRIFSGICFLLFQFCIMLTGNYAWINFLTLVMIIPCFEDRAIRFLYPKKEIPKDIKFSLPNRIVIYLLLILILFKSYRPLMNLIGPRQVMNTSYDQFHLVNSYGVFGSVTKNRYELIIEGSNDGVKWKEYEIPCKPGKPEKIPCLISPYHYRITWQIWFAAMGEYRDSPWMVNLVYKLLRGEKDVLNLLSYNPFQEAPPKFIRVEKYLYKLKKPFESGWYFREKVSDFIPPVTLQSFMQR